VSESDFVRALLVKNRENIMEMLVHPDVLARQKQAFVDALIYGRGMMEGPKPSEVAVRRYRPKLP
jgi:hypothetical protein